MKPVTAVTVGRVNEEAQVFAGVASTGAAGKITTLTVLLAAHEPVPGVPAAVVPHTVVRTYLAVIV